MIIVTNRDLQPRRAATSKFGKDFNAAGPDELRLALATKGERGRWKVQILPDGSRLRGRVVPTSETVFLDLQTRMREQQRDCVVFVHGYNTDFRGALETAHRIERTYDVEVVLFTWPSDGSGGRGKLRGTVKGIAAYKSDKNDAVRSVPALDRALFKLGTYFDAHVEVRCERRVSLLLHSMGAYLFKHLMKSSIYEGERLLFDNVVFCAADVNNADHAEWMDRIRFRRRLYVTINENDFALAASRAKFGDKQRARLGHFVRNLESRQAIYVDVTDAAHVGSSHSYFVGDPVRRNARLREFFRCALHGRRAEDELVEVTPGLWRCA